MQTRTRNALVFIAAAVLLFAALAWVARQRQVADLRGHALDAIPAGALLVVTADLAGVRASPSFAKFLREEREVPGLGKVRDICGFDPMDSIKEVAFAIPAAEDSGEFGLAAAGDIDDEPLLTCAAKVIEARGGRPVVTTIGSFRSVRDASGGGGSGEIAVRKGGPLILSGGPYLRAMIDAADLRSPTIRSSVAHTRLAKEVGDASIRITAVLTPRERATLADELSQNGETGSPATAIAAVAIGAKISAEVELHGVIICDVDGACERLATSLKAFRDDRAADFATRLVGFGGMFEKLSIEPRGATIHARVTLPADQAATLADRLVTLGGFRHPMPDKPPTPINAAPSAEPSATPSAAPSAAPKGSGAPTSSPRPDEVISPPRPTKPHPGG